MGSTPQSIESLWDDENFLIQSGWIPGQARISGKTLGAGIVYYPMSARLTHRLGPRIETVTSLAPGAGGMDVLWNAGYETEIFNPQGSASHFFRVALKAPEELSAHLPEDYLSLAYAALLQDDWADHFKASVRADLDAIRVFIEALRTGQRPRPEVAGTAILAKEDLDVKLLWSADDYRRRGIFSGIGGGRVTYLASATPASGLINVKVETKDTGNSPVSGCTVWYVTRINHSKTSAYQSFPQFSTPTSEYLAVGNYNMWAERGGVAAGTRPVTINSAVALQSVDLLAP